MLLANSASAIEEASVGFAIRVLEFRKSVRIIRSGPSPGETHSSIHL
jgi:hypothetical protein